MLIIRRSELHYTASGIIILIGGRPAHGLRELVQIFIGHSTHSRRPLKYLQKWLTVFFVASEICLELEQWSVCRGQTLCVIIVLVARFEVLTGVLLKTETFLGCDTLSLDE